MKTFRQLLRQPIKFIAGLILMTVAAAIFIVCVGQALAAKNTAKALDGQFTTVAIPVMDSSVDGTMIYVGGFSLSDQLRQWLQGTEQTNSDVIKTVAEHGIISSYIPEMTPLNYTQSSYRAGSNQFGATIDEAYKFVYYNFQPKPEGVPYSCAMLVITLEEICEPIPQTEDILLEQRPLSDFSNTEAYMQWYYAAERETVTYGYTVSLAGTVTEVVSLQEGYRDPTGMTARLSITVASLEELDALKLKSGESYLVYGMDYYDEDWKLRGILADSRNPNPVQLDAFDLERLHYLTEKELQRYASSYPDAVARYDNKVFLSQEQVDQINSISMTLSTPVPRQLYDVIRDDDGNLVEIKTVQSVSYTDRNGQTVTMSTEEYAERYQIPTIARLEGRVEDFLKSEEGTIWQQALTRDGINNHGFAVIGVDKLGYLADFAREESRVIEGRDFTAEELNNGERVCIIHEAVAAASGLEIGDTITLNLYHGDTGLPYQTFRSDPLRHHGVFTPAADFYFETTPILETAEYTIVGTYRSRDLWTDVALNEYAFSPNTVFVPKTSVETTLEYSDSILFNTVVLHNGMQEAFNNLAAEAGFRYSFVYYDQGYTAVAGNFHNYEALVPQVLAVGISAYTVILLLFLLLFPGSQGKTVTIMRSLGETRGRRFAHVMLSSLGIIAPSTVLGGGVGLLLWQRVLDALQESAETAVSLQLEGRVLLLVALAQFLLATVLSAFIAGWVTAPGTLLKRRSR